MLTHAQLLQAIAAELVGHSLFQYHRAISPGIQEYIEAALFYWYAALI